MENFEGGLQYGVVNEITPNKIVMENYYKISDIDNIVGSGKYIDKNKILNKVEYDDNEVEYIKMKKKFMYMCKLEIGKILDNNEYFKDVNKKQLIKLQKRLKIRP